MSKYVLSLEASQRGRYVRTVPVLHTVQQLLFYYNSTGFYYRFFF